MMESNERKRHTPGPWVNGLESDWSIDTDSSNAFCHVGPEGGDPVAIVVTTCSWDDDELEANARLIAAAPELLEALKLAVSYGWEHESALDAITKAENGL